MGLEFYIPKKLPGEANNAFDLWTLYWVAKMLVDVIFILQMKNWGL